MVGRFLILFAATNTLAAGSLAAFVAGGGGSIALGVLLALPAAAGFVVTARVVVLARPASRRDAAELRRLRTQLKETGR